MDTPAVASLNVLLERAAIQARPAEIAGNTMFWNHTIMTPYGWNVSIVLIHHCEKYIFYIVTSLHNLIDFVKCR